MIVKKIISDYVKVKVKYYNFFPLRRTVVLDRYFFIYKITKMFLRARTNIEIYSMTTQLLFFSCTYGFRVKLKSAKSTVIFFLHFFQYGKKGLKRMVVSGLIFFLG